MKIELNLLINKIKADKIWIISFISVFIICLIYVSINYVDFENKKEIYALLINYSNTNLKNDFIYTLYNLYFVVFTIYFSMSYFSYDLTNFNESLIIRENSKKWIIKRTVTILFIIIFIKLVGSIVISLIFNNSLNIKILLISILYQIIISLIGITSYSLIKKDIFSVIVSVILSVVLFLYLTNIYIILVSILLLIVYNYLSFSFKKIFKLKYS